MRLLTFACAALLAAPVTSSAQNSRFGAKGGVSIATQAVSGPDGGESLDARIGVVAGVFWTLPLASWLDLQAEGLYVNKGAKVTLLGVKSTAVIDYAEVPVLARVRFGSGHVRYYAAAGASTAFRVKAKTRATFGDTTEELDIADQVEPIDFGLAAGGGVEIGRLVFDGRYTFGFTDIDKDAKSETRNRAIAVTAGFRF